MQKTIEKTETSDKTINSVTAEILKSKIELSYRRIKELYEYKLSEIEKLEDKIAKVNEKLHSLKEERDKVEEELNGIYESYISYCQETGLKANESALG